MKNILCYGDSNTYGYNPLNGLRYPKDVRWTGRLQMLLGKEYHVIEEGCNGRTTVFPEPGAEWKCGIDTIEVVFNTHKPVDLVVMMLGSNDLKYFYEASAEDIAAGAEALVKKIRDFSMLKQGFCPKILLISPPLIGEEIERSSFGDHFRYDAVTRSRQFAKLYEKAAIRQGCIFLNAADYIESSKEDCLHLMPEAHAILAQEIANKILGYRIRKTGISEVDRLLDIYDIAKECMYQNGNTTQWGPEYPGRELLLQDIRNGESYVLESDGRIHGTFVLHLGEEPSYQVIEEGEWPNDHPYGTIHRIASDMTVKGIFHKVLEFCESVIPEIRIDTHENNHAMRHVIKKSGFHYCGKIYVRDHSERLAYHKSIMPSPESYEYEELIQYLLDQKTASLLASKYEIVGRRTRMTDFGYEKIPDAEIAFETGTGELLYAFAYQAAAYAEYGILDISWIDHDFDSGEAEKSEHLLESYDSVEDALGSPYIRLFMELEKMLLNADMFMDEGFDEF